MDKQQILAAAVRVVTQSFVGLLSTADGDGRPHSRLMGAAPVGAHLGRLYTLTGKTTRKVANIEANPRVCWVFFSPEYADVVTLYGRATVLESPTVTQEVWDHLANAARAYSMNVASDEHNVEFVVIETKVDTIEYLCPGLGMTAPKRIDVSEEE
jgi:general stress protein 26